MEPEFQRISGILNGEYLTPLVFGRIRIPPSLALTTSEAARSERERFLREALLEDCEAYLAGRLGRGLYLGERAFVEERIGAFLLERKSGL